jgi:hypothetical protein
METSAMKILLTSAALVTAILIASPVAAQEERLPSARALAQHQAVLRVLPRERAMLRRAPNAVFDGREYIGSDPDVFIRNDLNRGDYRGD